MMKNTQIQMKFMTLTEYHWMHVPTGAKGVSPFKEEDLMFGPAHCEGLVDDWNRMGRDTWRYWTE